MNRAAAALLAAASGALGGALFALGQGRAPAPARSPSPSPATLDLGGLRIHALQTGRVAVKRAHRALAGPAATRLGAIALDPRWTPWLPVTCWAIEHPEGVVMVDTGETARTAEPGYFDCDPGRALVYTRLLRFDVAPEDEAGLQLRRLGVSPEAVQTVAMTHLHGDHTGGAGHFPNARFLVGRDEIERPTRGSLPCSWPEFFRPEPVAYGDGPFGAFPVSQALTPDGAVRLVPTPGHTRGYQSVLVRSTGPNGERWVLLAGDASFDAGQARSGEVAGICDDVGAARRTLGAIRDQLRSGPTVYVTSHDPEGSARLAAGVMST